LVPVRVTAPLADHAAGAVADRAANVMADRAAGAVADRAASASPDRMAERTSGGMGGRRPGTVSRFVARRVVHVAAVIVCVLVLGFLLDDGFQGEQAAIEPIPPGEIQVPVTETPAPPIPPVVVTPVPTLESPRHATERTDGPRRKRVEVQRRNRRVESSAPRWRSALHASELPPWGQQ
jgi:hypothetical protein